MFSIQMEGLQRFMLITAKCYHRLLIVAAHRIKQDSTYMFDLLL